MLDGRDQPIRVAIVGGGVSGISCLWGLKDHSAYEVHLFEADDRLGGHANTIAVQRGRTTYYVDTGFMSINRETYRKSPSRITSQISATFLTFNH
jgi:predicted NAD/FAD-binding protein